MKTDKYMLRRDLRDDTYEMYREYYEIHPEVFYRLYRNDNVLIKDGYALQPKDFISLYDYNLTNILNNL